MVGVDLGPSDQVIAGQLSRVCIISRRAFNASVPRFALTRPIDRLARYADGIRLGKHPPFPRLGSTEIGDLGLALRRMQEALEGRQYAEEYVQTLTHELKSPLSAIRGAAELLEEGMPREQQARCGSNQDDGEE